ncbi:MAG: phosphoribosyltransferase family protein, partial [Acidimicrobiia bacterium]
ARDLALPCRPALRRVSGAAQTGRSRRERARGPVFEPLVTLAGGRVLVVDDVATTGASLRAAAGALRGAGAVSVVAATGARTPWNYT